LIPAACTFLPLMYPQFTDPKEKPPCTTARRFCWSGLSEATGDVVLGLLVVGILEDLLGRSELHEATRLAGGLQGVGGGLIGHTCSLLHVARSEERRVGTGD